ncbi:STAS domain-containing protein [Anabaena cylindrica UHCC 0172]|uniref:STAS domain-containing protein n=1 Tax=Anabaena cylindrica TaxID=1165 RepID=UPI002B20F9F3|nr:STAS domain-containing protein [Anabaena cylindrica]MEA5551809.1 STAS domain-containing protein [Anabaena cylindrica UHCC 0172]
MNIDQKIYKTQDGNTVIVLKPTDRLDITSAWQFRLKLQECISKLSRHIVVNLGQVDFIDSSGLTSLVAGMRDADKVKGSFRICNVHPDAKLVFEVTMMDTVFEIFETEEEALETIFPNLVKNENQILNHEHESNEESNNSSGLNPQSA